MSSSEIIARIWEGTINTKFKLDPSLTTESDNNLEYYTTIVRNSYFHFILPDLLNFFKSEISDKKLLRLNNWWFEFENVPLKWNLPVGLLYDLTSTDIDGDAESESSSTREDDKIWEIVLKYDSYPVEYIIPIDPPTDSDFLKTYWINQLKETCYILNGSSKIIMNMPKQQITEFYKSIMIKNSIVFENMFRKLLPANITNLKNLPIKVHLPLSNKLLQPVLKNISRKITLGNLLQDLVPDLFPSSLMCTISYPVSHGIALPLNAPLIDLYITMKYLDSFLHVCIKMVAKKD